MTASMRCLGRSVAGRLCPLIPTSVLLLMMAALLLVPLVAISRGYRPIDDALRHCAKAVTDRPWTEVLVLSPAYTVDHHQGWHTILGWLYRIGVSKEGLLSFSVVGLFLLALAPPLVLLRRGEYWLLGLAVVLFAWPDVSARFLLGRPYLTQTAVTLLVCLCWEAFERPRLPRRLAVALFVLTALSAWCRSTWYLFPLVPGAVWLAGARRGGWRTLAICMAGVLAGACLTGQPWGYFVESTRHLLGATQRGVPSWMLVTEFAPRAPALQALVLVGGLLLWRSLRGLPVLDAVRDPCFCLWGLSMLLGFYSVRFAIDFGVPALLVWIARQLQDLAAAVPGLQDERGWPRLALTAGAALVFVVAGTADLNARYSGCLMSKTLDAEADREWLPGRGGIFYSTSMTLFFSTFYQNPEAPWRYVLGFEPGMMTEANRKVYEAITQAGQDARFFEPWVQAMRPVDRLIIEAGKERPGITGLDWRNVKGSIWSGRLAGADPAAGAPAGGGGPVPAVAAP